jgi:hypothetical protein
MSMRSPIRTSELQTGVRVELIKASWTRKTQLAVRARITNELSRTVYVIAELRAVRHSDGAFFVMWAYPTADPGAVFQRALVETIPAGQSTELDALIRFPVQSVQFGRSILDIRTETIDAPVGVPLRAVVGWYGDLAELRLADVSALSAFQLQRLSTSETSTVPAPDVAGGN